MNPMPTDPWILKEWKQAEEIIDTLDLPFGKTKIYQDSLPDLSDLGYKTVDQRYPAETALRKLEDMENCRKERGIPDPPNDLILRKLVCNGCHLMVTEDLKHIQIVGYLWQKMPPDLSFLLQKLQSKRDPFIAQRINSSLECGDIEILFLGKDHQITDKLNQDIKIHNYFDIRGYPLAR